MQQVSRCGSSWEIRDGGFPILIRGDVVEMLESRRIEGSNDGVEGETRLECISCSVRSAVDCGWL